MTLEAFELRAWALWQHALEDTDNMSMTEKAENINLVTGGAGKHSCVIPSWGMTKSVTVPVLPQGETMEIYAPTGNTGEPELTFPIPY